MNYSHATTASDRIATDAGAALFDREYREAVRTTHATGKPSIVRTGKDADGPFVERVFPVAFTPIPLPPLDRYRRTRERDEWLLHGAICSYVNPIPIIKVLLGIDDAGLLTDHATLAAFQPCREWKPDSPDKCMDPTWLAAEKRLVDLQFSLCLAAGIVKFPLGPMPGDGVFLVKELNRGNRRGRPSLKHEFYDLAVHYTLGARVKDRRSRHGFFPALARHLSLPWLGISFSAHELRQAVHERLPEFPFPLATLRSAPE